MSERLIPFGLDRASGRLVEPEDALSGRACNCICPGCHAPLLSRHPQVNRIHFAHDSKHPDAKPDEPCPFSSSVAIAMMVRELAEELQGKYFHVPAKQDRHTFPCCGERIAIPVALSKRLKISHANAKPILDGVSFDLELHFGHSSLFIDLYYRGKPCHQLAGGKNYQPTDDHAGILALNCDSFDINVLRKNKRMRFSDAVLTFLLTKAQRHWLYHPRRKRLLDQQTQAHQCPAPVAKRSVALPRTKSNKRNQAKVNISRYSSAPNTTPFRHQVKQTTEQEQKARERRQKIDQALSDARAFDCLSTITSEHLHGSSSDAKSPKHMRPSTKAEPIIKPVERATFLPKPYRCAICRTQWQQKQSGLPECPQCKTHLYARPIDTLE